MDELQLDDVRSIDQEKERSSFLREQLSVKDMVIDKEGQEK